MNINRIILKSKGLVVLVIILLSSFLFVGSDTPKPLPEYVVQKIWDQAPHNAFTDIVRYKNNFYCVLREGCSHIPDYKEDNGVIRVLKSEHGKKWKSVAVIKSEKYDLRDPKVSVTPTGQLMILMGGMDSDRGVRKECVSQVSFSTNGTDFSKPESVRIEEKTKSQFDWIWKLTWNGKVGYAVMYYCLDSYTYKVKLLKTENGIDYQKVTDLNVQSRPSEAAVKFSPDNKMYILLRREGGQTGMLGISSAPFTDWKWNDLGQRIGGQDFLFLPNQQICIGSRIYDPKIPNVSKTGLLLTDMEGKVLKTIPLPSGGDSSYPGMVIYNERLFFSYYSSHEGYAAVYLMVMPLGNLIQSPQVAVY